MASVQKKPDFQNLKNAKALIGDKALFFITRNIDEDVVAFVANRKGDHMLPPDSYWTRLDNPLHREEISQSARDAFYGTSHHALEKGGKPVRGKYRMMLNVFKNEKDNRIISVKFKKDGSVKAYVVVNKEECILHAIHTNIIMGMPPSIESVTVRVETRDGKFIEDNVTISDDITSNVDVSQFLSFV